MEDEPERLVREDREVAHVALDRLECQPVARGDLPVAGQLKGRVVEDSDPCARGRQDRPLLAASRRQAQDVEPRERREPVARDRFRWSEHHRPLAPPCGRYDLWADRDGPAIPGLDLAVPGAAVVVADIQ